MPTNQQQRRVWNAMAAQRTAQGVTVRNAAEGAVEVS